MPAPTATPAPAPRPPDGDLTGVVRPSGRRPHRRAVAVAAAAGLVLTGSIATGATAAPPQGSDAARLVQAVTLDGTVRHLTAFQRAADVNDGNRAAGTTGHAASAGYVAGQLVAAGYDVDVQPFTFPSFEETAPAELRRTAPEPTDYVAGEDFATFTYSGSGDVSGPLVPVDLTLPPGAAPNTSTSGCEAEDFDGFPEGAIALVQRGTCSFFVKATNAAAAGAAAVVVFNEGQEGRTGLVAGTLGETVDLPVVGTTFAIGQELAADGTEVRVSTSTLAEDRTSYNVIAESRKGRSTNVVMLGAHLDSVPEGPGINDNGSGSAAVLETAIQLAKVVPDPRNKVRFAWWSAEENGLLGSAAYVEGLSTTERGRIALYMNFDMVGSPNFARFVYDGDDSDAEGSGPGPRGSAAVEDVFEDFYDARGLAHEGTDFNGRSDYGPFIDPSVGIPAGGLFSGAEGIKSEEQQARYGGEAGVAFDSCYHQACDTTRNLSYTVLGQNVDAIANAAGVFAESTEAVNGRGVGNRGPQAAVAGLAEPGAAAGVAAG